MKLSQLKYFQTVCCFNSVTKAALALNIAQPSITASIKSLEDEFGVDLFRRVKQKLVLTKEGAFFLKYANELLSMADGLEQKMLDLKQHRRRIRIAVPPISGTFSFNKLYFAFRGRFPKADVEIVESGSSANLLAVAEESVDLALANTGLIVNDQLNVLPLKTVRIMLSVSRSHPLARKKSISLDMLRDEPLVLFRRGTKHNDIIEKHFADLGIKPNILLYSSQIRTIQEFVAAGCAAALIYSGMIDPSGDTVNIPVPELPGRTIDLVWKKSQHLNNRERYLFQDVERFVSFAREYIAMESKIE